MATRNEFNLSGSYTHTIDLLSPHTVECVTITYPTAKAFNITIEHWPGGESEKAIEVVSESIASARSFIGTPDNLVVRNGDKIVFTNSNGDTAEVGIEFKLCQEVY